ncbi:MAG: hypothetical protein WD044_16175 [Dongiaceae bacterium]
MRIYLLLIILISITPFGAIAQTAGTVLPFWQSPHVNTEYDAENLDELLILPDGDMVVIGFRYIIEPRRAFAIHSPFLVVHRIAPDGNERWWVALEIEREAYHRSVSVAAPDGGLFLCDGADSIYRLDADGKTVWRIVKRGLPWLKGCQDLAYHPSGLLILSGVLGTANMGFKNAGFQPTLIAYDAATGEEKWKLPYLPLDTEIDPHATKIIIAGDELNWWGNVSAGLHTQYLTDFSFSFRVGLDGRVLAQTSVEKFLDCWRGFGAFVAVDGRVYAEFCECWTSGPHPPDSLFYWDRYDWTQPHLIYLDGPRELEGDRNHVARDFSPVGSTPGTATFLFVAHPTEYSRSLEDRNRTIWLDLVTIEPDQADHEDYRHTTMSIAVSEGFGWTLKDLATPGGNFRIAAGQKFFILVGELGAKGRYTYRVDEVAIR